MKIDRCRSFRRYTSPEAETNGSTTIVVAELRVSRIFSQVLSINRRVSLADESLLGMISVYFFIRKLFVKGILRWIDVGFLFLVSFDENYPILFARKSIVEIENIEILVWVYLLSDICVG